MIRHNGVWTALIGVVLAAQVQGAADQQAVADTLTALAGKSKVICDQGIVTHLAISNHKSLGTTERLAQPDFVENIVKLPDLEAIALERQDLDDDGYAVLGRLKKLRDVRLHYMGDGCTTSGSAPMFINELPLPLEVLEIKHGFKVKGGCMGLLKPQPELRKLEIDMGYADSTAVEFIEQASKLENLQIHRTTMTDEDLQRIFAACPELKVLLLRPTGQTDRMDRITGRSLRGLKNCPKLEMIVLGIQWGELPWDDCLGVLAQLPNLKQIQIDPNDIPGFSMDDPAIQRLLQERPDITIRHKGKDVGGAGGAVWTQEDADWDWDGGVTTHG